MKILVTGSSGFLGKRITSIASAKGHEVIGLDLNKSCNTLQCNLSDKNETTEVLKDKYFNAVIHLAGIRGSYEEMTRVNIEGTTNLLNALNPPPECFVLASSCAVYGIPQSPNGCIHEDDPTIPITDYGRTMLEKEKIAMQLSAFKKVPFASARIFNLFGADQAPSMMTSAVAQKLVKIFLKEALPPLETGPLHTLRDLIDVNDVAEVMVLMATQKATGIFNVGAGTPRSGTEVVRTFQSILKMQISVKISSEFNPMVQAIYADISKMKRELNWTPSVPFRTTLESIVVYWLKQETT